MKQPRLRLDFSRFTDADLEAKSLAIVEAMTVNAAYFTTPKPTMAELTAAVSSYGTALSKAASRDKALVASKNSIREMLEGVLLQMGYYVSNTAKGNEVVLTASGYELVKPAENRPPITTPENLTVMNGNNSGEMLVSVDSVKGALSYVHEYTQDPITPASVWTSTPSSARKYTFADLEAGKKYWFRVAAVGPRQQVVYTSIQPRIVV